MNFMTSGEIADKIELTDVANTLMGMRHWNNSKS